MNSILFECIPCSSKKNFGKQPKDSTLKELQLGIDKGCFFRIWEINSNQENHLRAYMIIRNWWWQMT
jgi:hypothetical protein